jgi:hypothetical protein
MRSLPEPFGWERQMRFENTEELKAAEFVNVDLSGARGRNVNSDDPSRP